MEILALCRSLFLRWNESGVVYCHWKSNEHLIPALMGKTDLDILISRDSQETAELIMTDLGLRKCKSQFGSRYRNVCDWLGVDPSGAMIHIHLHYALLTGHQGLKEYNLPWTHDALAYRQLDEKTNVSVIDPNLEILELLTRVALKKVRSDIKKIKHGTCFWNENDRREFTYLKERIHWDKVYSFSEKYFKNTDDIIAFLKMDTPTNSRFLQCHKLILKDMQQYRQYNSITTMLLRNYYWFTIRCNHFLRNHLNRNTIIRKVVNPNAGMILAFIGQDGAGKSTVTNEIAGWLSWKLDARRFYLGSGDHYKSWQKSFLGYIEKNNIKNKKTGYLLYALLTVSNYKKIAKAYARTTKKAERYAKKGGIALFDRYPQIFYEGRNDGPKIRPTLKKLKKTSLAYRFISHSANVEEKYIRNAINVKPDLVFKLMLSPEESIRRKPEESLEEVKIKHTIIQEWDFINVPTYQIDAEKDYSEEVKEIKEIIWEKIKESSLNYMDCQGPESLR